MMAIPHFDSTRHWHSSIWTLANWESEKIIIRIKSNSTVSLAYRCRCYIKLHPFMETWTYKYITPAAIGWKASFLPHKVMYLSEWLLHHYFILIPWSCNIAMPEERPNESEKVTTKKKEWMGDCLNSKRTLQRPILVLANLGRLNRFLLTSPFNFWPSGQI